MSAELPHTVILVPGLGDDKPLSKPILEHACKHWSTFGLEVIIHSVLWRNGEDFEPKLLELLALIDQVSKDHKVSLIGTSAGASLAFNAFLERPNGVHRAVNSCGRLRAGNHQVRSLQNMARTSPAFYQSVTMFEQREPEIPPEQRARMMTIRPFFGDELVPHDTAYLEGADNRWQYTPGHMLSIYISLRFPHQILQFLNK